MRHLLNRIHPLMGFLLALCLAGAFAFLAPVEQTLGTGMRLVFFHGAWVWVGILLYVLSAVLGLIGLVTRREMIHIYSAALGRSALVFWVTYLPMSLMVMQIFWNGFFFDEPRWRIPFMLGLVSLCLQVGLWLIDILKLNSLVNLLFGVVFVISMSGMQSILHPESPVSSSSSWMIKVNFSLVFILSLFAALWLVRFWTSQINRRLEKSSL